MQSALHKVSRVVLLFLGAALALLMPALAPAVEVAMPVEVPAGQYRALKMRNLVKDVVVAVIIQAPDKLVASVMSEADYRLYPKPQDPVFVGTVDKRLSFTVVIPQTGHYFLVFDNRQGSVPQKVKFLVRAERKQATQPGSQPLPANPAPPGGGRRDQF
jgi:hypothetical protein